ncbi:lipopolysaccharide assembly protein LapA domain-containing protein [Pseudomonas aeruginosa]|uniref:lipopolysaccharide assembly protein LapA domain-containing protein n=1 Tax=Pseudomonas aeruginosa TaxID=287 RepID=UPI003204EE15
MLLGVFMLLRRLAIAGFFFLLALIVIVFVLENLDSSHVTFLGRQSPEFPLVLLLLSSFVMGGLLVLLMSLPGYMCTRSMLSGLRTEVAKLRTSPLDH